MPAWAGKWKGGRFYLDEQGRPIFVIESNRVGVPRSVTLTTHDPELALGDLARFQRDPVAFVRPAAIPEGPAAPVYITKERLTLYMESIHTAVKDHRAARRSYIHQWSEKGLDLRTVDRKALRAALAEFDGGHRGRVEALNAFCRFLVREGDLPTWNPLVNTRGTDPKKARAERVAYALGEIEERYRGLTDQAMRDVLMLRVSTGMHYTEIEQLKGCKLYAGPLPDKGAGIRELKGEHEIKGVLQFRQKTKPRHRVSVNAEVLAAALRLRAGLPSRVSVWKALDPIVPSNLRHTWITLCGEVGEIVNYKAAGIPLDQIQGMAGHRIGSKVTLSNYDKAQIPPMSRLPLQWG